MIETLVNWCKYFLDIHLWSGWRAASRVEENGDSVIWFERECVYCKHKETRNFGE